MSDINHKSFTLEQIEFKGEPDHDGEFSGYASVFDVVDGGMDVMDRSAFTKSIGSGRKVKMLWQHNPEDVIGVWDEIRIDERGLFVKGRLLKDVAKGREAMALLRNEAINSMSIGYKTVSAVPEGAGRVRRLMEVDLYEVSLVTFPMLEDAQVTDVKSIQTARQFEAFLRDAGYSRKDATGITLHGFKALNIQRDAATDEVDNEGIKALLDQINKLQRGISNV